MGTSLLRMNRSWQAPSEMHILLFSALPYLLLSPTCTPLPVASQSGSPEPQDPDLELSIWGYVLHAYKLSVLNGILKFLRQCVDGVG